MLEAYKNIDGLAAAWRRVVAAMPEARLVIVGRGSRRGVVDELVRDLPENVEHVAQLPPEASRHAWTMQRCSCCRPGPKGLDES